MVVHRRSVESFIQNILDDKDITPDIDEYRRDIYIIDEVNQYQGPMGTNFKYCTGTVVQINRVVVNSKATGLKNADKHYLKFVYIYRASVADDNLGAHNFKDCQLELRHALGSGYAEWNDDNNEPEYFDDYGVRIIQTNNHFLDAGMMGDKFWDLGINMDSGNFPDYIEGNESRALSIPDPRYYTDEQSAKYTKKQSDSIGSCYTGKSLIGLNTKVLENKYDYSDKLKLTDRHGNDIKIGKVLNRAGKIVELAAMMGSLSSDVYVPMFMSLMQAGAIIYHNPTGFANNGRSVIERFKPAFHKIHNDKIEQDIEFVERAFTVRADTIAQMVGPIRIMFYYTDFTCYYKVEFLDPNFQFGTATFINNIETILGSYEYNEGAYNRKDVSLLTS